jgi:hypothetical protein
VQGVGVGRALYHPLKRIAAAVGVGHGRPGVPHRPGHLAQRQIQPRSDCCGGEVILSKSSQGRKKSGSRQAGGSFVPAGTRWHPVASPALNPNSEVGCGF